VLAITLAETQQATQRPAILAMKRLQVFPQPAWIVRAVLRNDIEIHSYRLERNDLPHISDLTQ
jgi:hypothetical protein